MSLPNEIFDEKFVDLLREVSNFDFESKEATAAVQNLETFSRCRPPAQDPEPEPQSVPTTIWEKVKANAMVVWDNETTRVLIKTGGTFTGVALVAYSTIRRDHILERQALAQANQRSS